MMLFWGIYAKSLANGILAACKKKLGSLLENIGEHQIDGVVMIFLTNLLHAREILI